MRTEKLNELVDALNKATKAIADEAEACFQYDAATKNIDGIISKTIELNLYKCELHGCESDVVEYILAKDEDEAAVKFDWLSFMEDVTITMLMDSDDLANLLVMGKVQTEANYGD